MHNAANDENLFERFISAGGIKAENLGLHSKLGFFPLLQEARGRRERRRSKRGRGGGGGNMRK